MNAQGIKLEVAPTVLSKYKFDMSKFFSEIVEYEDTDNLDIHTPSASLDAFRYKLHKHIFSSNRFSSSELRLSTGVSIGIMVARSIKRASRPHAVSIHLESEKVLKKMTQYVKVKGKKPVEKEEIGSCLDFGGELLNFTEKDIASLKDFCSTGLTLIGFKDRAALKFHQNLQGPITMIPNDKYIEGSSVLFDAMVDEMLELNKVAIARVRLNKLADPRIYALIPENQHNTRESKKARSKLFGICLPFADDIRNLNEVMDTRDIEPDNNDINIACNLIKNMRIDEFDPNKFENPSIQRFNQIMQALALNEKTNVKTRDVLQPDYIGMKQKKKMLDKFKYHFFGGLEEHKRVEEDSPVLDIKRQKDLTRNTELSLDTRETHVSMSFSTTTARDNLKFKNAIIPEPNSSPQRPTIGDALNKKEQYLLHRIKTHNYNSIKMKDLDDFIYDHDIPYEGSMNKADKIKLIVKHMSS